MKEFEEFKEFEETLLGPSRLGIRFNLGLLLATSTDSPRANLLNSSNSSNSLNS